MGFFLFCFLVEGNDDKRGFGQIRKYDELLLLKSQSPHALNMLNTVLSRLITES